MTVDEVLRLSSTDTRHPKAVTQLNNYSGKSGGLRSSISLSTTCWSLRGPLEAYGDRSEQYPKTRDGGGGWSFWSDSEWEGASFCKKGALPSLTRQK
jgi:hypothetical protein